MSIRRKIGLAALCAAFSLTLAACGGTSSKVNAPGRGSGDNGGGDGQVGPTGRAFHITPCHRATGACVAALASARRGGKYGREPARCKGVRNVWQLVGCVV